MSESNDAIKLVKFNFFGKIIKDGRKVLIGKWVFKMKCNADGETSCYKARFVFFMVLNKKKESTNET